MGFIITINSNGTLIDEKWAKFFGEHKPRRINITLYGTNEQIYRDLCHYPGGFARTIQGIRLLREHGVDVKVNGSATKENQGNIKEILEIAEKLEVPVNIDTYMMPGVREREKPYDMQSRLDPIAAANARMEAFKAEMGEDAFLQMAVQQLEMREQFVPEEEKPGQVSCLAGNCSFTINWQGELRPCVMLTKPAVSAFEAGFEKGWKYIVDEVQKLVLSSKCSVCDMRPMCRVCAAGALLETGSYDGVPEYMCLYAKESYRLMEEYVKERAR